MRLLKSTATVGGATILSRILGFLRDVVFARLFGASGETDAFFLAFKIPNFMRRLFGEGSFSLAFVPVLSELAEAGDKAAAESAYKAALPKIDKSVGKGLIHRNKAARHKSRLNAQIRAL